MRQRFQNHHRTQHPVRQKSQPGNSRSEWCRGRCAGRRAGGCRFRSAGSRAGLPAVWPGRRSPAARESLPPRRMKTARRRDSLSNRAAYPAVVFDNARRRRPSHRSGASQGTSQPIAPRRGINQRLKLVPDRSRQAVGVGRRVGERGEDEVGGGLEIDRGGGPVPRSFDITGGHCETALRSTAARRSPVFAGVKATGEQLLRGANVRPTRASSSAEEKSS